MHGHDGSEAQRTGGRLDARAIELSGVCVALENGLLGDYFAPTDAQSTMELTFLKLHGPAVTVEAADMLAVAYDRLLDLRFLWLVSFCVL